MVCLAWGGSRLGAGHTKHTVAEREALGLEVCALVSIEDDTRPRGSYHRQVHRVVHHQEVGFFLFFFHPVPASPTSENVGRNLSFFPFPLAAHRAGRHRGPQRSRHVHVHGADGHGAMSVAFFLAWPFHSCLKVTCSLRPWTQCCWRSKRRGSRSR